MDCNPSLAYSTGERSFTVASPAGCAISLTSPMGGETWLKGTWHAIQWTKIGADCSPSTAVDLYKAGSKVETLAPATGYDLFNWLVPTDMTEGNDYAVRVTDTAALGVSDQSRGPFAITAAGTGAWRVVDTIDFDGAFQPFDLALGDENVYAVGRSTEAGCVVLPIDRATRQPLTPIAVAASDWCVQVAAGGGKVWAATSGKQLAIVDQATGAVEAPISLPASPGGVSYRPDGKVIVDTSYVFPWGEEAYASTIDPGTRSVQQAIPLPGCGGPGRLTGEPGGPWGGGYVYVPCRTSLSISTEWGGKVASVDESPMATTRMWNRYYVVTSPSQGTAHLAVFDADTNADVAKIPIPLGGMDAGGMSDWVFVAGNEDVVVVNRWTNTIDQVVPVAPGPRCCVAGLTTDWSSGSVWVANQYDGSISVIQKIECAPPATPTVAAASSCASGEECVVGWSATSPEGTYEVQEATDPAFLTGQSYAANGTATVFSNLATVTRTYYYRVRALSTCQGSTFYSSWSNTVAVVFTPVHTVTVARNGSGAGTVTSSPPGIDCGTSCSADFLQNTVVTMAAVAASGSTFAGWSGEVCSGVDTCQFAVVQAREISATFNSASCAVDLSNQTIDTVEVITSCGTLSAGNEFRIESPGELTLRAPTQVVFKNGFSVGSGAVLHVVIDPTLAP